METKSFKLMLLAVIFFFGIVNDAVSQSKPKDKTVQGTRLLKGNSLNNWVFYLRDHSVDPASVFTIQNGVVHITGNPFGYMRTRKAYSDYALHVEYRWPVEATNSGIFLHCQLPDTIWITGIECQLQKGNAGDFACVGQTDMKERVDKSRKGRMIKKLEDSTEKPVGEWNTVDITCKGNTIEVYVNGVLQNRGTEVSLNKGYISLQSEGKEIEFKNVILKKL